MTKDELQVVVDDLFAWLLAHESVWAQGPTKILHKAVVANLDTFLAWRQAKDAPHTSPELSEEIT